MFLMRRNGIVLGLAVALLGWMLSPVLAEEGGTGKYRLETVKVSAQKREENVQEVPLSVYVLSDVNLEEERVYEFHDLGKIVPNLYIGTAGGSATYSYVSIRGRMNTGSDVDPTVTLLVDGVPYDNFWTMGGNLIFDVERVEVLRGPQSTMFGLNSAAGVVNIITKKPGDILRYGFLAEASGGPDFEGSYTVSGNISGPVFEDTLSAGVAFMSQREGGYIENLYTGDLYNGDEKYSGRGSLVWTPTEDLEFTLGLTGTKIDSDSSFTFLPMDEKSAAAIGMDYDEWKANIDWEGFSRVQTLAANLSMNYDLGLMELISTTTYSDSDQEFEVDFDLSTNGTYMFGGMQNSMETFSQELRLQSTEQEDAPLEWLVGYFYHKFLRDEECYFGFNAAPDIHDTAFDTRLDGSSHSLFGQATYRLLDRKLGLTVGLRQEWTSRDLHDRLGNLPDLDTTDSEFLPKFVIDYRFSPKVMAYMSATKGWRSGGYFNQCSGTTNPSEVAYDKETSWTYEVGAKTQFLNNRLLLNAALFHTIYDDYQDQMQKGLQTFLLNAGEVTISGLELEARARLLDNLLLTLGFGYVTGEYKEFQDDNGDYSGNKIISVPEWNLSMALRYSFLDGFYIRPEVQGVGSIYWDRLNEEKQDPYFLLNLRAGYAKNEWEVYVFVENLTNEYKFVKGQDFFSNGIYYGVPVTPFQVGIGINWNF